MLRGLTLIGLVCLSTLAWAEEAQVDDVLKSSSTVSEEKLVEAAEQMNSKIDKGAMADTAGDAHAKTAETARAKPAAGKGATVIPESQIPVLKDEATSKLSDSSPWMRLIGCAIVVLAAAGLVIFAIKRGALKKNSGGKTARIEILHQHFLGPKKSLALIQVAGEAILIGVTDHNITMIKPVALIDDELAGQSQEFHGFLDEDFAVEQLMAPGKRTKVV